MTGTYSIAFLAALVAGAAISAYLLAKRLSRRV